jgi:hypothetical protein
VGAHFGGLGLGDYIPGYESMLYGGLGFSHQFGKPTKPFQQTTRKRKTPPFIQAIAEHKSQPKSSPTEHLNNTTVSSEKPFFLQCDTVRLEKHAKTAHVYVEKEQDCTFTQKGRSHPFRLQPGSNMVCGNWSGGPTVRCVPIKE